MTEQSEYLAWRGDTGENITDAEIEEADEMSLAEKQMERAEEIRDERREDGINDQEGGL